MQADGRVFTLGYLAAAISDPLLLIINNSSNKGKASSPTQLCNPFLGPSRRFICISYFSASNPLLDAIAIHSNPIILDSLIVLLNQPASSTHRPKCRSPSHPNSKRSSRSCKEPKSSTRTSHRKAASSPTTVGNGRSRQASPFRRHRMPPRHASESCSDSWNLKSRP